LPAPFAFGQAPFGPISRDVDDVLHGTVGVGAYFARHLRGDITLDFRGKQGFDATAVYSYPSSVGGALTGNTVNGVVAETFRVRGTVAMINGYVDILPRGIFSPYVGAGVGFVYYDVDRLHVNTETHGGISRTIREAGKDSDWGLAAALMAGVSMAVDQRWVLDVGYRAQYLDEASVELDLPPNGRTSKATIGAQWEHQVRVGVRFNIW
jgi:opacity protein-like surface antigen